MGGVSVHVKDSVITQLNSSIQIDFFIQIQYRLLSQFPTLAPKALSHVTWLTCNTPSDGSHTKPGMDIQPSLKIPYKVIQAGGEKDPIIMCRRWWITHIFLLSCQQQHCTYHLPNDRDAAAHRSQMASVIIPRFWFTFESDFDCIRWCFFLSPIFVWKRKAKKKDKVRTRFNWTWKFWLF